MRTELKAAASVWKGKDCYSTVRGFSFILRWTTQHLVKYFLDIHAQSDWNEIGQSLTIGMHFQEVLISLKLSWTWHPAAVCQQNPVSLYTGLHSHTVSMNTDKGRWIRYVGWWYENGSSVPSCAPTRNNKMFFLRLYGTNNWESHTKPDLLLKMESLLYL